MCVEETDIIVLMRGSTICTAHLVEMQVKALRLPAAQRSLHAPRVLRRPFTPSNGVVGVPAQMRVFRCREARGIAFAHAGVCLPSF